MVSQLNVQDAYEFYEEHIYNEDLMGRYQDHDISPTGTVSSKKWELLGAILTGNNASEGYGADLEGVEVKSSSQGSFEYQYHLNGGIKKLQEDQEVDHYFVVYDNDYSDVEVWAIDGESIADKFQEWIPEYKKAYEDDEPNNRYRRTFTLNFVKSRGGELIMKIVDGDLRQTTSQPSFFD